MTLDSAWSLVRGLRVVAALLSMTPLFACTNGGVSDVPLDAGMDAGPLEPVEDGTYFVHDDDERVVILRGMNIMSSAKGHPERLPNLEE
ncbi:MAG TPA: hypothetical protein VFG22_13790, partial [Polyangiales bacterium]|nr:hypothetical protein [Polyangiales bacterium]